MTYSYEAPPLPSAFIWRRAHSLTGLWLVIFLIEHLLTNSQAALFLGDDGKGFVNAVNGLKNLPYLPVIEIGLLGIPFLIHGIWGVRYLFTSKANSFPSDGSTPSLTEFSRNHAYTWQRITSWILLFGILAHVIHMRFYEYPSSAQIDTQKDYMVVLDADPGIYPLSNRLGFKIYDQKRIHAKEKKMIAKHQDWISTFTANSPENPKNSMLLQKIKEEKNWLSTLTGLKLNKDQVIAISPSFGLAELLMVRETFKSPTMILLYSGLVLAACFHAFNGLWTFMISWGITLTSRSQKSMRALATGLMVLISFLGLASIWGTYWINLIH